ncbi:AMP-binding protein [Streptomyces sp. NPDC088725]|uniref:AMP-binding protein n=1 Tax=Streptomyces sp. NPDC088725 TaxID=3365873 RepID=UPI003807003E
MVFVFQSEYAEVPAVDQPIHEAVLGRAAGFGDLVALVDGRNGTTVTYAQLDDYHRRIAAAFTEAGIRKGDVLALHSPNNVAYPAVLHAATRAGAAVTTIDPLCTAEELADRLRDSGARWIVTASALLNVARRSAELVGGVKEIFVCDRAYGHRSILDMSLSTAPRTAVPVDPGEDIALLPYSSGTTGAAKGVMLTHRAIATNLAQLEPLTPVGPGHRVLAAQPFFRAYGLTALMNAPLRQGATVVVLPRFELEQFLWAIDKYRVSGLYVTPPIVLALARHPSVERYDLSSLEYVLSAEGPLDARLAAACARRLGVPPLRQAYGMTELSSATHVVPPAAPNPPPGAVGKLLPGTELRIAALGGGSEDAGGGADGEILVRGPQLMKGYLNRPGATAATIDAEGWLHTGDAGHVDGDGWLFVTDRVEALIRYKGSRIAPSELEAVLLTHESVADAAVIGVDDEDGNEVPKAYIVRRSGAQALTEADVMAYVAERVAPHKKVRRVAFIGGVPRAATGKILRRELRERRG